MCSFLGDLFCVIQESYDQMRQHFKQETIQMIKPRNETLNGFSLPIVKQGVAEGMNVGSNWISQWIQPWIWNHSSSTTVSNMFLASLYSSNSFSSSSVSWKRHKHTRIKVLTQLPFNGHKTMNLTTQKAVITCHRFALMNYSKRSLCGSSLMWRSLSMSNYPDLNLAAKCWGEGQRDGMVPMSANQVCARVPAVVTVVIAWLISTDERVRMCTSVWKKKMDWEEKGGGDVNSRFAPFACRSSFHSHVSDSHQKLPDCCSALIALTLRHACFCFLLAISASILERPSSYWGLVCREPNIVDGFLTWCLSKFNTYRRCSIKIRGTFLYFIKFRKSPYPLVEHAC